MWASFFYLLHSSSCISLTLPSTIINFNVAADVHFAHMNKNGRGIKSGLGTCACNDVLQCTCNVDHFRTQNDNPGRGNKEGKDGEEGKDGKGGKSRDIEEEIVVTGARKGSTIIHWTLVASRINPAAFFTDRSTPDPLVLFKISRVPGKYKRISATRRRAWFRRF